jgi:hypothetical protein
MEDINTYFNLDEPNDLGDTYHSGSWSKDHLDPTNTWGNGMCFVYYNRNCSFKLKQEIWQKYTSKIIKLSDMELLTNDTPFTNADAEVKQALHQKWFAREQREHQTCQ